MTWKDECLIVVRHLDPLLNADKPDWFRISNETAMLDKLIERPVQVSQQIEPGQETSVIDLRLIEVKDSLEALRLAIDNMDLAAAVGAIRSTLSLLSVASRAANVR